MMNEEQLVLYLALTKMPNIGPVIAKILISYCGGIEPLFGKSKQDLLKIPGIGPQIANNFEPKAYIQEAEKEIHLLLKSDVNIITYHDKGYPKRMLNFDDAPILLFYRGNFDLDFYRTVAIVGTRTPTHHGIHFCEKLVEELAAYQVGIISGLAFGIDGVAHRKSVEHNIPTLGILGNGLPNVYPAEHRSLTDKMVLNGGLLSEFSYNAKPARENFPMRNRIIAGMSDVVIVIESKSKGGSIITAEFANDYNKDVFAVPGRVSDEFSEGCNQLIKQNKAHLIESAKDIAYIMRWDDIDASKTIQKQLFVELDEQEKTVLDIIKNHREIAIDMLSHKLQMNPSEMASVLLELEFKGLIKTLPGKKYILT
ncbi:MAG: DNA-processing protein DprA [Chitinophagales bacterium]|nr:DNA-processing protein DprA [Chitinophagales bacterium]